MAVRTQPITRRKRAQPSVSGGVEGSYEDKDSNYACPVCFNTIEEAYITRCGHSFCCKCIMESVQHNDHCPKCNSAIEKKNDIFPNFTLNELIVKHNQQMNERKRMRLDSSVSGESKEFLPFLDQNNLNLSQINYFMNVLTRKREALESEYKLVEKEILKDFLVKVKEHKAQALDVLQRELKILDDDLQSVEEKLKENEVSTSNHCTDSGVTHKTNGLDVSASTSKQSSQSLEGFNTSRTGGTQWLQTTMASRRKRMDDNFEDLKDVYFSSRQFDNVDTNGRSDSRSNLEEFGESLSKFTKFSSFRTLATLNYASDIYSSSSIVSSIEFDRDCDYFAIAGVTKKIKVFEYNAVIRDPVDVHYPVIEMLCNSKISSVIWSSYHKNVLASSDYEGSVTLWDTNTGTKSRVFQEHEKRCWSVDFNRMDPKLLASGSDDSKGISVCMCVVKLWCTNMEHSVASLEVKANVCCVKFNPESRYHLAFGSADHCIHYYDLRNSKEPLNVFRGHKKAVSYAKFISSTEIVSASTDSQLKLWSLRSPQCLQTFKGHVNEKNFVGLATDGDYIACGSENNSMYVYYKRLPKHILTFRFDNVRTVLQPEKKEEDGSEFVSSVCWRNNSNVVISANSQGIIKVLELV